MLSFVLSLAVALAYSVAGGAARAESQQADAAIDAYSPSSAPSGLLLAKDKDTKKKKKKKKKTDDDEGGFGPEGVEAIVDESSSGSLHHEQEGTETPYKAEASLNTNLSFLSTQVGDGDAAANSAIDIGIEWLFIIGPFGVGPDIHYDSTTDSSVSEVPDGTTGKTKSVTVENKASAYSVGGVFKWYFGKLDHSDLVPFGYAGIAYRGGESKSGDADAQKTTGSAIRLGGGLNLFIDSNIAFNPHAEYVILSDKGDGAGAVETKTSGVRLLLGIAVFI